MKSVIAIIAAALLAGCATPYQARGLRGGYAQTRLNDNVFQVSFRGNAYVSAQRVADYTLLRSAEVALEQGFGYFVIVDSAAYETHGVLATPQTTYTSISVSGHSATGTSTTYPAVITSYSKPSSRDTIVCFKERPDGFSYDARQVIRSLRQQLGLD